MFSQAATDALSRKALAPNATTRSIKKAERKHVRTLTVRLYTPHSGQEVLHASTARFRVMCCGRRWGKTLACCNEIAKHALENANTINWWVAPSYQQARIAFRILRKSLADVSRDTSKSLLRIELLNGSIIECKSADKYDNLRGEGVHFLVIDEFAKVSPEAWNESLRPTLSDTDGRAIIISTPRGRDLFYQLFLRGSKPGSVMYNAAFYDDEWEAFSFPTATNPFIKPKEIESARRTIPEMIFRQEFMAEFLDDAATVFRGVDACAHAEYAEPVPGHHYVVGWDVAKNVDYSVFTVVDVFTNKVVAWDRYNGVQYTMQIDRLTTLAQHYNYATVIMDATGVGDPIFEMASMATGCTVEPFVLTNTSKKELIERLAAAIERRAIAYPPIPELIHELKAFAYNITRAKNIVYNAPPGEHDDTVISLALAVYGLKLGGPIAISTSYRSPAEIAMKDIQADTPEETANLQRRQNSIAQMLSELKNLKLHEEKATALRNGATDSWI